MMEQDYQKIMHDAAIQAIRCGWTGSPYQDMTDLIKDKMKTELLYGEGVWLTTIIYCPPYAFARALWGEEPMQVQMTKMLFFNGQPPAGMAYTLDGPEWQVRITEMMLSEDPLKYLGENLPDSEVLPKTKQ